MALYLLAPDQAGTCCDCASRPNPCDMCGGVNPCALQIGTAIVPVAPSHPGNPAYQSFTAAQSGIAIGVSNCVGYTISLDNTTFTATNAGTSLTLNSVATAQCTPVCGRGHTVYTNLNLKAGAVLSTAFTISNTTSFALTIDIQLLAYNSKNAFVSSSEVFKTGPNATATLTFTAPSDDSYTMVVLVTCGYTTPTWVSTMKAVMTCSLPFTVNPAVALYTDGATTRQLEACPKYTLPTLYATQADAQAVLSSTSVSNCIGYIDPNSGFTSFTATDLGGSIRFNIAKTDPHVVGLGNFSCSANISKGDKITVAGSVDSGGTVVLSITIIGSDGNVQSAVSSSPFTSIAMPYNDKYTIFMSIGSVSPPFSSAVVNVSAAHFTINHIEAKYTDGNYCPAKLACAP